MDGSTQQIRMSAMQYGSPIKRYQSALPFFLQTADCLIIMGVLLFGSWLYGVSWNSQYSLLMTFSVILYLWLSHQQGMFNAGFSQKLSEEFMSVAKVWGLTCGHLLVLAFLLKISEDFSRVVMVGWLVAVPFLLLAQRILSRQALSLIYLSNARTNKCAIAGCGELALKLAKNIESSPWMGLSVVGCYDNLVAPGTLLDETSELEVKGRLKDLSVAAKKGEIDIVYLALPMHAIEVMKELLAELVDSSVQVEFVPDVFTFNMLNSRIKDTGGLPTISVYDSPMDGVGRFVKRVEDVALGSMILCLIAIPMLFIALAVKLTSPGPAIFKQRRYGLNGESIEVWKFRSMTTCDNGDTIVQAKQGDARITKLGAILRKTSLDELPQFINVLQGTMSLVGPRPHAIAHNEQYRKEIGGYMQRHLVKPGITGWAQINGWRGETGTLEKMEKRIDHDMYYIRNWSVWFDFKIIFLTIFKGFVGKSVY